VISGHLEHLWLYLLAPVIGSILAIAANRLTEINH